MHNLLTRNIDNTNARCLRGKTGSPCLLCMKIEVGIINAFTGSPSHRASCSGGGKSPVSSKTVMITYLRKKQANRIQDFHDAHNAL